LLQIQNCSREVTAISIVDKIETTQNISVEQLQQLLAGQENVYLKKRAAAAAQGIYGRSIYIRGLIEFTNYCQNDCFYCGIRRSNQETERYRLTEDEILACCIEGYRLGYRTFVLQGGEDAYFTDDRVCRLIGSIKKKFGDCAVTLSIGEKSRASYERYFSAGADRYLLRHETADMRHYQKLHPAEMSLSRRRECLYNLKELGFQVGAGFMVGSPGQTADTLLADLQFLRELQPHMVGIGPFIPQHATPFGREKAGSCEQTLTLLSIVRLLLPHALLPATTALGTLLPKGREAGILAGANVLMPNLSPRSVRRKYTLYDHKLYSGEESAQYTAALKRSINAIGYEIVTDIGDFKPDINVG